MLPVAMNFPITGLYSPLSAVPGPKGLEGSKVPIGNGGSEYEAGLLAADGKTGIDTAWLREQLDMPGDLAD